MRLAVHYGCHLLRPQPAVELGRPAAADEGRDAGRRARRARRRLPDQDAVLRRRARPRRPARDVAGLAPRQAARTAGARGGRARSSSARAASSSSTSTRRRSGGQARTSTCRCSTCPSSSPCATGTSRTRSGWTCTASAWTVPRHVGRAGRGPRQGAAQSFDVALLDKCDACGACKDDCPVVQGRPRRSGPTTSSAASCDGDIDERARRRAGVEVPRVLHVPRAVPLRHRHGRDAPQAQGARRQRRAAGPTPCARPTSCSRTTGCSASRASPLAASWACRRSPRTAGRRWRACWPPNRRRPEKPACVRGLGLPRGAG